MNQITTKPESAGLKRKRPAVVSMCIGIFALLSVQGVMVLLHGFIDLYILIQTALIVASLFCLLIRAHSQITYYVTSASLVAIVLKTLDSAIKFRGYVPAFPRNSPFNHLGLYVVALIFCLLLWRYTLGRPSRKFYGFIVETV